MTTQSTPVRKENFMVRFLPMFVGLSISFSLAGYKSYKQYRAWKYKHFPNVLYIQLNTILQTKKYPSPKYRLCISSLYTDSLTNIIYNQAAIKYLQKRWGSCTKTDPIIRFPESHNGHAINNAIIAKFESQFRDFWINRANEIGGNIELDNSQINYDNILSEQYVFALTNGNKNKTFYDLFHEEYKTDRDDINMIKKHEWSQDLDKEIDSLSFIRGLLISNKCVEYFINKYGESINTMTESDWQLLLDTEDVIKFAAKDPEILFGYQRRWMIIRKIIQQYMKQEKIFNGEIRYGKPLCLIHLPSFYAHSLNYMNEKPQPLLNSMPSFNESYSYSPTRKLL